MIDRILSAVVALFASALLLHGQEGPGGAGSTVGSIIGVVELRGSVPPPRTFRPTPGTWCADLIDGEAELEDVVMREGRLANVFLWLTPADAVTLPTTAARDTVEVVSRECRFTPRVVGLRVGGSVRFTNHDSTLVSFHQLGVRNGSASSALDRAGTSLVRTFAVEETMVAIVDDLHPWKRCYIGLLTHPWFAVSNGVGSFTVDAVPPGRYTLNGWHERFGRLSREVEIVAGRSIDVTLEYAAQ